jgi:hypothetical protein
LLDVWVNLRTTEPGEFQQWQAAVTAYPGRAELWYGLGDTYYHYGLMAGLDNPLGLAPRRSSGDGDRLGERR